MNQDITYQGFSSVPSDYECPDGALAVSVNLIPEDGALHPILPPAETLQLSEGDTAKFIHKTSTFTHYIIYNKSTRAVSYIDKETKAQTAITSIVSVTHFNAVGNTLLAFTECGIYYLLWKDGKYNLLGDHIPNLQLSFGLVGHPRLFSLSDDSKSTFEVTFTANDKDYYYGETSFSGNNAHAIPTVFAEKDRSTITSQIMAKVNKFIAQETVNNGRFCFPFFVRYAIRLFDGNLIYHSAPILMNPSTTAAPLVFFSNFHATNADITLQGCDIMLVAATLDWRTIQNDDYYNLKAWSDIIKSVDVFISKPIYTYDQSGEIESWNDTDNGNSKFIGRLYAENDSTLVSTPTEDNLVGNYTDKNFLKYYSEWKYSQIYGMYYNIYRSYPAQTVHLPEFTDEKVTETISNNSQFYKLCSLELSEIQADSKRHDIVVDDDYLQSLVTREAMTDDYLSRDQLHADYSFAYNSRLNLSGLKRKPFAGFYAQSLFAYCNALFSYTVDKDKLYITTLEESLFDSTTDYSIQTYIKENGQEYVVESTHDAYPTLRTYFSETTTTGEREKRSWGCWLYYPNTNAYKMVIGCMNKYYVVNLKAHDFLNGAYALLDYELVRDGSTTQPTPPSLPLAENAKKYPISIPNKVYTSQVNNPFYYPVLGINSVGTGEIKGICSAAKALSQGQFGQFPLYAFTTDGVWALEVSSTGSYSAKQPITRDVCINSDGITQLDSAVLFPTDRGLMLISGSQAICISDTVNSEYPFDATKLPGFSKLHNLLKHNVAPDKCLPTLPFTTFLKQCQMIYDYVHQRVIVYAPGITYAYAYSLKTQQWGMMFSDIKSHLNSYPEALAVNTANVIVNYSEPADNTVKCLYTTRAVKLDSANTLKTIDSVIQRGLFRKGHVATALYGSRNLINWHLVWSSQDHYLRGFRGTPYKYFRIAGIATLSADESINGASIQFTTRQNNQPR